jgi:hypothetical protein
LTDPDFLQLMRKNAQQIKVAARAHNFRGFAQQLDFAGCIRDRAVLSRTPMARPGNTMSAGREVSVGNSSCARSAIADCRWPKAQVP